MTSSSCFSAFFVETHLPQPSLQLKTLPGWCGGRAQQFPESMHMQQTVWDVFSTFAQMLFIYHPLIASVHRMAESPLGDPSIPIYHHNSHQTYGQYRFASFRQEVAVSYSNLDSSCNLWWAPEKLLPSLRVLVRKRKTCKFGDEKV